MTTFQHEALLYAGRDGFLAGTVPFLRAGVDAGEPMLVAVGREKIAALRDALGDDAGGVAFVDMAELGANPNRIIPAWADFLEERPRDGSGVRGIGEPIWAGRSPPELVECQLHESLLNVAFAGADDFRLMCPYDTTALGPAVVHEACCSHPFVSTGEAPAPSRDYREGDRLLEPFDAPLPKPPRRVRTLGFEVDTLHEVRRFVAEKATEAHLDRTRRDDLVLAVDEVAANSTRHGGGRGVLRVWRDEGMLVCEVRDRGRIDDPLVGRHRPTTDQVGGWGVWIANQLCDFVQVRSGAAGTVVRLAMHAGQPPC